jgi:hypothetical protein
MKVPQFLAVVTAIENIVVVVAIFGMTWIASFPYRLSLEQAHEVNVGYSIVGFSLAVAWFAGVAGLIGAWATSRKGLSVEGKVNLWVVVSFLITLAVTVAHLTSVRVESVGL